MYRFMKKKIDLFKFYTGLNFDLRGIDAVFASFKPNLIIGS